MNRKSKNKNQGFTLIELLVVIAIIAILAAIIFAALSNATKQAEGAAIEQELNEVTNSITMFYNDHGYYPTPPDSNFYCLTNPDPESNLGSCGNAYSTDLTNQLMPYFDLTTLFNSTLAQYGLIYLCGGFDPSSGYCDIAKMFYSIPGNSCVLSSAIDEGSSGGLTLCLYQFPTY